MYRKRTINYMTLMLFCTYMEFYATMLISCQKITKSESGQNTGVPEMNFK